MSEQNPPPPPPKKEFNSNTTPMPRVAAATVPNRSGMLQELLLSRATTQAQTRKLTPIHVPTPVYHPGCTHDDIPALKKLRIVIVSDSHNTHEDLDMPDGDVLIHCGDMSDNGREEEIRSFNGFLGRIKHKYPLGIYVICGNHETGISHLNPDQIQTKFSNATYLHDSKAVIADKIVVYGSPWVPNMGSQLHEAHMKMADGRFFYKGHETLSKKWAAIPDDVNILITHTPPKGVLDGYAQYGCSLLRERVSRLPDLRIHCFGHVHMGYGYSQSNQLLSVNAAVDEDEQPIIVDYYYA